MKTNIWKKSFFILLIFNIVVVLLVAINLLVPIKDENFERSGNNFQGYVPFLIHTKKENLNEVINHYIEKEASGGPVNYEVVLGDEVELYGTIPIFTEEIQLKMTFEPKAMENGDLILQQKSMTVGQMQLPVSYILNFIRDRYHLPKGVIIQPHDKLVYISMQKLKLKSDFKIKVNKFDLKQDDISVQLFVPIK
ncbi:YpmS family protein [Bacillus sp. CGMCC 1.16607]|uniref:YpmS family protein n=1 Tax=Bacillus sp. CGMCC 1.16607 TaxID=3351842 RepID=UPI00362831D0